MNYLNLNLIPSKIKNNEISQKDALNLLSEFLQENGPVFGLHKYDADFRSELTLMLLEKGNRIFDLYDENVATFFTYFYKFIQGLKLNLLKRTTINQINESIALEQSKENYYNTINEHQIDEDYLFLSQPTNFLESLFTEDKINTNMELLKIIKMHPRGYEKFLLVLSLKNSYHLTEKYIQIISKSCNISKEKLYDLIDYLNSKINSKQKRRKILEEKRNNAYFRYKKSEKELSQITKEANALNTVQKEEIIERYKKTSSTLNQLNKKIFESTNYLKPTNKDISDALGLCERQVNYYVKAIKRLTDDSSNNHDE